MRWQKWFICAFLHSHKCVCPYLLYNHVHASCYSKPKLNARWLNPIQCLSAFNHICCWNHPHRCAAWWQTHCKPTELFIAFTLHACTISLVINEPCLWSINAFFLMFAWFSCFLGCFLCVFISLIAIAWIVAWGIYCQMNASLISIIGSVRDQISIKSQPHPRLQTFQEKMRLYFIRKSSAALCTK